MYFCIRFNVLTIILADAKYKNKNEMDTLYLLQFACFLFMLVNILILGITRLHMKWMNRRYEVSRWLIIGAMVGLAIQFLMQMLLGFRAQDAAVGAVFNILVYPPCFSLISIGIYNIEATHANRRKMSIVCASIYAAILAAFCIGFIQSGNFHIRQLDLCDDSPVRLQRSLLHLYDNSGNQKAQKNAGGDGWL